MPKRPDTLETVRIALEVLRRIPRRHKITSSELHEQLVAAGFDRDLRSIQRLLDMLSENFDIERDDRSKPYGYRWKEQSRGLALTTLNEQESLLLTLAEQHLRNLLPANLMKSMAGFFAQARSNLGHSGSAKQERQWLAKVRVVSTTQPLLPPKIAPGVFEQVSTALFANRWLEVEYKRPASSEAAKAEVMPLGLAQQGARLYLVCRFRGFNNERSLALHRIVSARALTLTFDRPREFNLQKFDDDGRFGFGEGQRVRLTFRIKKGAGFHLLESPLSTDQSVVELPSCYKIAATVVDTAQLDWWLKGFGDQIESVRRRKLPIPRSDSSR